MNFRLTFPLLFLLTHGNAAADEKIVECAKTDLAGIQPFRIPPHSDLPKKDVEVVLRIDLYQDGTYRTIQIEKSSESRPIDRAALYAARKTRLEGECLQSSDGQLNVLFLVGPNSQQKTGPDAVSRVWRSPKKDVSR